MTQLIEYMTSNEFFNEYCKGEIEQLYARYGNTKNNQYFEYKEFIVEDRFFYIVDLKEEATYESLKNLSDDEPRCFKYNEELRYNTGKIFSSDRYVDIDEIIFYIISLDSSIGQSMLEKYYNVAINSIEVMQYSDNILAMSQVIEDYLKTNQIYLQNFDIDYDALDKNSITKWFQDIHQKKSEIDVIPSYNDSDYRTYLVKAHNHKDYYIIENFASDKLFIYDKYTNNSGAWFAMPKNNFKNIDDDMHDALYDSNQYVIKNIEENLNFSTLIAEYKDGKVVKATNKITQLDSVQSYIYGQLYVENKVSLTKNTNFSYMLANYRMDNDSYQHDLDEIYFVPFLHAIKDYPGTLYYYNYHYYKSHENVPSSDSLEERVLNNLGTQETNYSHLKLLPEKIQNEILTYIKEHFDMLSVGAEVKKHLTAIENLLLHNIVIEQEEKPVRSREERSAGNGRIYLY